MTTAPNVEHDTKLGIEYEVGISHRLARLFDGRVTVSQSTDLRTLTLETPTIHWPSVGQKDSLFTAEFVQALERAIRIAHRWDGDVGKSPKDVLK